MTSKGLKPQDNKRATRSAAERTGFEAWVAKMLLSGYVHGALPELYEKEFDRVVSPSQVIATIRKLKKEWKVASHEDMNYHLNREVERLDVMEMKAWDHYRTCGGTLQDTEIKALFDANGDKKESLTTIKTKDDPRLAMQWFDRILKIQHDRRKVLKLETKIQINNIMAIKGYAYFDPGKDWADPPNAIKANVIDAEFSERREDE